MTRPAELFAIAAIALLTVALLSRSIMPNANVSANFGRAIYVFPSETMFFVVAAFFCLFAVTYSLWMLPLSERLALWHFGMSILGIGTFCICFYVASRDAERFALAQTAPSATALVNSAIGGWLFASLALIVVAQGVFLVNLVTALLNLRRLPPG